VTIQNTFTDLSPEPLAADDLADFTPKPPASSLVEPSPVLVERAAEKHGFTLNNFPAAKRKTLRTGRVASKDKAEPMSLRLRVADWNRFSTFCENQGLTVADGFAHILNKLEI
jgi:hypothetical protein